MKKRRSKTAHLTFIADVVNKVEDVINTSKEDISKEQLIHEINKALYETHAPSLKARFSDAAKRFIGVRWSDVLAESWRPAMMYIFMVIIINQFMVIPIVKYFIPDFIPYEIPELGWTLLITSMTGYVVSRGAEKFATTWKGGQSGYMNGMESYQEEPEWIPDGQAQNKQTNIYIADKGKGETESPKEEDLV